MITIRMRLSPENPHISCEGQKGYYTMKKAVMKIWNGEGWGSAVIPLLLGILSLVSFFVPYAKYVYKKVNYHITGYEIFAGKTISGGKTVIAPQQILTDTQAHPEVHNNPVSWRIQPSGSS